MKWNYLVPASIVLAAASFSAQAANSALSVSVTPDKQSFKKTDDVTVKVTITNHSDKAQMVLKWNTPFGDEIEESLFDITRDGQKVAYQGPHYKRPTPNSNDYYLLKPGQSYSAKVELSAMYDMSVTGDYTITFRTPDAKSDTASVWIDGSHERGYKAPEAAPVQSLAGGSLSFNKCTASQQADIVNARTQAGTYSNDALAYLNAGKTGTRYTKWFGAVTSARYATAKSHFTAIADAFANKPITVDCGCKKTYYAYVYPNQPYTIYVCKAFWTAPMAGTDSKGGTLVHEMSHFTVTAGTDDHVYGQTGAANLALTDPDSALDNADSHEYFGENTPAGN